MTLDLSHLTAATRELACNDAKARILSVQTARWVAYPRAGIAVEELERRFHYPTCARMPCMLLYGDSGMGKSMILEKMERQHPSSYDERKGITKRPVVIVQMPSSPDERRSKRKWDNRCPLRGCMNLRWLNVSLLWRTCQTRNATRYGHHRRSGSWTTGPSAPTARIVVSLTSRVVAPLMGAACGSRRGAQCARSMGAR